ncbi:MAG: polysaccharide biosynthesis protein [Clostridia bacterium]|nr:polysaccharide biosynthesis protein [Clostridia bacterium]
MLRKTKKNWGIISLVIWDVVSIVATVFLSNLLFFYDDYGRENAIWWNPLTWVSALAFKNPDDYIFQNYSHLVMFIVFAAVLFIFLNAIYGNYTSSLKHFGFGEVVKNISSILTFGVVFYVLDILFIKVYENNEIQFTLLMTVILLVFSLAGRSSVRIFSEIHAKINSVSVRKAGEQVRTLIFGAGEAGAYFCAKHKRDLYTNVKPVVFIDDDESLIHTKVHGVYVYGGSDKLEEAIKKYYVDEVIVAIPTASKQVLQSAVDACRNQKCKIRRFGNVDDVDLSNVKITNINLVELLRRDKVNLNMKAVQQFVRGKTVLVTGGAGSIGSEICRQVLGFGCEHLVVFDIHENGLFEIENELKKDYNGKFSLRLGSIRDEKRLSEVFGEFDIKLVFHAAAHKHVPMMEYSPKEAIKNNVRGTINVAMQSIIHKCEKFILISTDKAVNPTNIMGASKRIAEQAIQLLDTMSDTDLSAVRFGNVLGSNGSVVPVFKKQIEQGGPVTVTHPDMRRYFMTIPEAVQLVLEAGAMAKGGEIFVLNMGNPVKIYDLACDLIRLSGLEPEVDIKIVFTGLRPGEKLFEEISMRDEDVTKTPNEKIFIMKPKEYDESELSAKIKELEKSAVNDSPEEMFKLVKILVPTFKHK